LLIWANGRITYVSNFLGSKAVKQWEAEYFFYFFIFKFFY
jgi:hypothetical protein